MNRFSPLGVWPIALTPNRPASYVVVLMVGGLISLLNVPRAAIGQSNVVFMAADVATGNFSKLVRFDAGTETFAVAPSGSHFYNAVTVLNGEVLVADGGPNAIQRFSPNGTYLGDFASPPGVPLFLESDSYGNVYALIRGDHPPPFFECDCTWTRYNASGGSQSFFLGDYRVGIDADAAGNVYIAGGGSLRKYAPNGTFLNSTALGSISPEDLAIDEVGQRLYLADARGAGNGAIRIFDISTAAPSLIGSIATPANATIYGIHFATESGNILTTDLGIFGSNDARGLEYSPSGELLREYRPAGAQAAIDITTLFVPEPPDYNRDGVWDAADYVVWRKGLPAADGTGNGTVDDDDYLFWQKRFGQSAPINAGALVAPEPSAAVPEPSTVSLFCLIALGAPGMQRRSARIRCIVAGATVASCAATPLGEIAVGALCSNSSSQGITTYR